MERPSSFGLGETPTTLRSRYFLSRLNLADDVYISHDDLWENAKRKLAERFCSSLNLESCLNLIQDFEAANPKYTRLCH